MAVRIAAVEDLDVSFWAGRRVLVTGHTGFKGVWLSLWLTAHGADVCGYSLAAPSSPSMYEIVRAGHVVDAVEGDIRDTERLAATLAARRPEVVFHLAAQPLVRRSYDVPRETFETNVIGTVSVLDAVRSSDSVRAVVNVTSDKVYEDRGWVWPYRETDRLGGRDPYSTSKACAELVTASYRASFLHRIGVASARAGNVFGGGDFASDRLVPDAMRAAAAGTELPIRNPDSVRPWQHVLNAVSGYVRLAERLSEDAALGDAWNFGPAAHDIRPVASIADRLCSLCDGLAWSPVDDGAAPRETRMLAVDSSKAQALLGWSPVWELDTGLARTIEWHRALAAGEDMHAVTLDQIDAFEAALSRGAPRPGSAGCRR